MCGWDVETYSISQSSSISLDVRKLLCVAWEEDSGFRPYMPWQRSDEPKADTWYSLVRLCEQRGSRQAVWTAAHYWHHKPAKACSLWSRQTHGSGCPCTSSYASFRDHTAGLGATWHMEKTTRPPSKMLGGTSHHGRRALSSWCLECCDGSVGVEGATTHCRSSVRERERERSALFECSCLKI